MTIIHSKRRGTKEQKRTTFNTGLSGIRRSIKMIAFVSILLSGFMPFIYWNKVEPSAENPMNLSQLSIFVVLITSAIVNLVYGVMAFLWSLNRPDSWFMESKRIWIYNFWLLMLGGAFLVALQFLYIWRYIKKYVK